MKRFGRAVIVAFALTVPIAAVAARSATGAPEGQMTYAVHVSLAPTWFDPAETSGMITPFLVLYALHDALVKPMPGNGAAPSLAESWTAAPDGLSYEFVLRKGATFHNGDPVTADDVKFSFERYRGNSVGQLKSHVAGVDVIDTQRVRFRLKEPWPDFMAFYGTPATGAGWIVPRKYVEKVGDEGFKKAPIGAGPYKFVSFNPGVELVLEAHAGYWRKTPSVKRLVLRVVPDESTRLAMLKNGEADVAYSIRGALAEELRRSPGLTLKATYLQGTYWVLFADQWDPKSPWADRRVRLAASQAMNRKGLIDAETLGLAKMSGSIIPAELRVLLARSAAGLRSRAGQEASRRGRFPPGLRRRRLHVRHLLQQYRRDYHQRLSHDRHPHAAASTRARRLLQGVRGKEAQTRDPGQQRGLRYRRDAHRCLRRRRRRIRVRQLSRHRGPGARAGDDPRSEEARADLAQDPAAPPRQGRLRADLGAGLVERPGSARRGGGPRAHFEPRLLGALRGPAIEEAVSSPRCSRRAAGTTGSRSSAREARGGGPSHEPGWRSAPRVAYRAGEGRYHLLAIP
jgi:hypothetical protein